MHQGAHYLILHSAATHIDSILSLNSIYFLFLLDIIVVLEHARLCTYWTDKYFMCIMDVTFLQCKQKGNVSLKKSI